MKKPIFFIISLLVLTVLACSFNFSTANIAEAAMARDPEGTEPTTVFQQDEAFYCVVDLDNAPDDTQVKAVWTAVEAEGTDPNLQINETEITSGDGQIHFDLTNDKLWPVGSYKVDLYLNDELAQTLEFEVEGTASAVTEPTSEPEPVVTDEPTEIAQAPTEEATAEPTAEATPTAEPTDEPTDEPTVEATLEFEPLPMKDEPYVHPSGAFTLTFPASWEGISGDKTSVAFGADNSAVGVVFTDAGKVFSNKEMQEFMDNFTDSFVGNFADDYQVLEQKVQPDDSIYLAVQYEGEEGAGDVDFFFEQRDTVIFILYFVTDTYQELQPTWDEIIATYSVNPEAAIAAAPAAQPTPVPTKPPAPAGPAIPGGKGMLTYTNRTNVDFVVDVIGPTNASQVVPPNQTKEFILDPGHYTINAHSAGGDFYVPSYEFDIAAGQLVRDGVQ